MTSKLFIRSSFAVFVCLVFGFMGTVATQTGITDWYPGLEKPWFHIQEDLFSGIWILIFLNGFWFLLFFALKQPFIALLDLIVLFVVILFTIRWFKIVNPLAAYLLMPYAVWVLFAIVFNFEIWRLNS